MYLRQDSVGEVHGLKMATGGAAVPADDDADDDADDEAGEGPVYRAAVSSMGLREPTGRKDGGQRKDAQDDEERIRAEPSQRAGGHVPGGWKVAATKSLRRATGQKKRRHKAPGWRPTQRGGDQYRGGEG